VTVARSIASQNRCNSSTDSLVMRPSSFSRFDDWVDSMTVIRNIA